jgi:transcriptional regulator with XRE-family HTH domain
MDTDLARKIGAAARAARADLALSQADAAERIGISAEFYARIERGATLPSTPTLAAIADGLEVSADALLGRNAGRQKRSARKPADDDRPEVRRLLRRVRHANPKTVRLLNLLAAALGARR